MARKKKPAESQSPDPVNQIYGWIISGASEADIVEAIKASWPNRNARPLIAQAIERFAEEADVTEDLMRGFCIAATRELYRKMVDVGDFVGAMRALKQMHELGKS
jgi:hypothetical protein